MKKLAVGFLVVVGGTIGVLGLFAHDNYSMVVGSGIFGYGVFMGFHV